MNNTTNYQKFTSVNPIQNYLINNFYDNLLKMVKKIKPQSILDAGCGEGFTLAKLKENGINSSVQGFDSSPVAIKIAKKIHPQIPINLQNIYDLPYPNNSFDLVICNEVLEHLSDPPTAVKEIVRVSNKNVIVSVPLEPWFQLSNFLRGKYFRTCGNHPEHINHWSNPSFILNLSNVSLKTVETKFPFPWMLIWLQKQWKIF